MLFILITQATGCIIAELVIRDVLFKGKSEGDQLFTIFKILGSPNQKDYDELTRLGPFDCKVFKEFGNFKKQSLRDKFYYIQDYDNLIDLLTKMFIYNPNRRITAVQALKHPFFKDVKNL